MGRYDMRTEADIQRAGDPSIAGLAALLLAVGAMPSQLDACFSFMQHMVIANTPSGAYAQAETAVKAVCGDTK